uniref:Uncharacterized protein n=1 Tax=Picea glauca TaxID=3330 RepID=A0A101LWE8_PICGL|nr:hypothetical protein ABT39_MTgene1711 [Picea glauca]
MKKTDLSFIRREGGLISYIEGLLNWTQIRFSGTCTHRRWSTFRSLPNSPGLCGVISVCRVY